MNIMVDRGTDFMVCSPRSHSTRPGETPMKWMLFAASAAIAAGLWLPGPVTMSYAAQPTAPAETAAPLPAPGEDKITFDQYREWRLRFYRTPAAAARRPVGGCRTPAAPARPA